MASIEAKYFHSTPYKFNLEASKIVIAEFCTIINDVSARCWYDAEQDVFCLSCPTSIGPEVDFALGRAISKYLATELAAVEREDRAPKVHWFPEQRLNVTEVPTAATQTAPTSSTHASAPVKRRRPLTIHLVSTETTPTSLVKFFKLRDLPEGMLERTLTSQEGKFKKVFTTSVTCRVTRWCQSKLDYVFSGRVGTPITADDNIPESDILRPATFNPIGDRPIERPDAKVVHNEDARPFRFVGDKPTVQQWTEGIGQIEPDEPDVVPEMPKDAAKFRNRPFQQTPVVDRMRIPKCAAATTYSSDEESEQEAESTGGKLDFSQLFRPRQNSERNDIDDKDESQSDESTEGGQGFDSLFQQPDARSKQRTGISDTPRPPNMTTQATVPVSVSTNETLSSSSVPCSTKLREIDSSESGLQQDEYFPAHDRFAKVDDAGLTSNAASQANWEHANPAPRKAKSHHSGIGRRATQQLPTKDIGITTKGQITAVEHPRSQIPPAKDTSSSFQPSFITMPSYVNKAPDPKAWRNRVNRQTSSQEKLIDDSSCQSPSQVKIPPGLEYGQYRTSAQLTRNKQPEQGINQDISNGSHSKTLITFDNRQTNIAESKVKLPTMETLIPLSSLASPSYQYIQEQNEDVLKERLMSATEDTNRKQYTMRQKTPKKGKASNSASKKNSKRIPKVDLPKPDLPPQPKQSSSKQQLKSVKSSEIQAPKIRNSAFSLASSAEQSRDSIFRAEQDSYQTPAEHAVDGLQKLLQEHLSSEDITGAELSVQFGLILLKHSSDKKFLDGVCTPKKMEAKLENAASDLHADFFPRMTTSETDARFLLGLMKSDEVHASVEYEIHVKTSEGESRLVRFEQSSPIDFFVLHTETIVAKFFMHYPMRVWDAQATIEKPEVDREMISPVGSFVESVRTVEEAPSFHAIVPSHLFTIEKVHAKRIFSKNSGGIEIRVAEVQELELKSLNCNGFNFEASTSPRETMVDEQRLWWECLLHSKRFEPVQIAKLHEVADKFLGHMDGVGWENKGPFERKEVEYPDQSVTEPPFW